MLILEHIVKVYKKAKNTVSSATKLRTSVYTTVLYKGAEESKGDEEKGRNKI